MEEGEQRRGEEMGLTVKQRQAVMNELRGQDLHTPPNEKSRILDGFVDQGASQPFIRTQHPASKDNAGNRSRASPPGLRLQGGGPPCAHGVLASVGQALWQASCPVPGHPFGVRERVHEQPPRSATLSTSTSPRHGHARTGRMTTDQWSRRTGASSAGRSGTPGMTPRRKSCS
jgi:hypothetical protein